MRQAPKTPGNAGGSQDMGAQASPPAECNVSHPMFHIFDRHCNFHFLLWVRGLAARHGAQASPPAECNAHHPMLHIQATPDRSLFSHRAILTNTLPSAAFRRRGRLRSHVWRSQGFSEVVFSNTSAAIIYCLTCVVLDIKSPLTMVCTL